MTDKPDFEALHDRLDINPRTRLYDSAAAQSAWNKSMFLDGADNVRFGNRSETDKILAEPIEPKRGYAQRIKNFAFRYVLEISAISGILSIAALAAIVVSNIDVIVVCMMIASPLYALGFFHGMTSEIARSRKFDDRK